MITDWDSRFMSMAKLVASFSKDPSTKAGAVIVRPNNTVVSVGYNGFPRGMEDSPDRLENRDDKYSRTVHCEMNAILLSKEPLKECALYVWPFLTCDRCAVHVIQSGIKYVIAQQADADRQARWGDSFAKTLTYYEECGVHVTIKDFAV